MDGHREDINARHVLVRVPYETALRRVSGDPGRELSKDPEFLKATHDRFRELKRSMPKPHFVFDTEARTADDIATELGSAIFGSWSRDS
ncbi:MAG: hypothetical protein M3256_22975 [Actinomycetota bacterium]|nr:hypothetical protein [Actinomycetota bacterium]